MGSSWPGVGSWSPMNFQHFWMRSLGDDPYYGRIYQPAFEALFLTCSERCWGWKPMSSSCGKLACWQQSAANLTDTLLWLQSYVWRKVLSGRAWGCKIHQPRTLMWRWCRVLRLLQRSTCTKFFCQTNININEGTVFSETNCKKGRTRLKFSLWTLNLACYFWVKLESEGCEACIQSCWVEVLQGTWLTCPAKVEGIGCRSCRQQQYCMYDCKHVVSGLETTVLP